MTGSGDSGSAGRASIDWTPHEVMLWETTRIVGAVLRGERLASQPCNFALSLSVDMSEALLVSAGYNREWLGAAGDGSYGTSTTFVGGFGPAGMLLGAATLGASAVGNASRRSRAAADASVAWREFDAGVVHVTTRGFYFDPSSQLMAFGHPSVQRMDLIGPGAVQFSADMNNGTTQTFRVVSVCSELMFVLWALARCPSHPQLLSFTWLPGEFMDRVRYAGLVDQLGGGSLAMLNAGA